MLQQLLSLSCYILLLYCFCLFSTQASDCNVESDTEHITDEELFASDTIEDDISGAGNQAADDSGSSDEEACYHFPLYEGCRVSVGAAVVLIMTLTLRHNLSWVAVEDILTLMNFLLPISSLMPKSRYLFEKLFMARRNLIDVHYYCPFCFSYITDSHTSSCARCLKTIDTDLYKSGHFFLHLPLEHQLRDMYQNSNLASLLTYRFDRQKVASDHIEDIYDGTVYKKVMGDKYSSHISLTWNTDGVPVFESSKYNMWPIQCIINELPIHLRKKHILLTGLWFGTSKPNINCFLQPFVSELTKLSTVGFQWLSQSKETCTAFVHAVVCSADAVARCMLQGIKQFNGQYGCSWCLHPGEQVEKGGGTVRVYTPNSCPLRNHATFIEHAKEIATCGNSFGVINASRLLLLPDFDIVRGFAVDYMHCVLLGVTRSLCFLWFDSEHHNEPYYFGRKISYIDNILLSIRPPSTISRAPRSVTLRCYWKASEWRNWLLMYAVLCLNGVLQTSYFHHFVLLVCAIDILNGVSISISDLQYAENLLHYFVQDFGKLYGKCNLSYNVHQLTHLPNTVRCWGPLWTTSAFPFESGNGMLMKLFNGTQGLPAQVSRRFSIFRCLPVMAFKYIKCENIHNFFNNILSIYAPLTKILHTAENVSLLGRPCHRHLTAGERLALDDVCPFTLPQFALYYCKAIVKGYILAVNKCKGRWNNSCIMSSGGICGLLQSIVKIGDSTYMLCKQMHLAREFIVVTQHIRAATGSIKIVSSLSDTLTAIKVDDFEHPCIYVDSLQSPVVCLVRSRFDGD